MTHAARSTSRGMRMEMGTRESRSRQGMRVAVRYTTPTPRFTLSIHLPVGHLLGTVVLATALGGLWLAPLVAGLLQRLS